MAQDIVYNVTCTRAVRPDKKEELCVKIIKRNGTEADFDIEKINRAVTKANNAVEEKVRLTPLQIRRISERVEVA